MREVPGYSPFLSPLSLFPSPLIGLPVYLLYVCHVVGFEVSEDSGCTLDAGQAEKLKRFSN